MTVIYRTAIGRLIATENQYADVRNLEPGETSTVKVMTRENLDTINHFELRSEADGISVEYSTPKSHSGLSS
jgi:hypothetical protein